MTDELLLRDEDGKPVEVELDFWGILGLFVEEVKELLGAALEPLFDTCIELWEIDEKAFKAWLENKEGEQDER